MDSLLPIFLSLLSVIVLHNCIIGELIHVSLELAGSILIKQRAFLSKQQADLCQREYLCQWDFLRKQRADLCKQRAYL